MSWGAKLNKGALDPYLQLVVKSSMQILSTISRTYAIDLLETYMGQALDNTLTEPHLLTGFYKFYDSTAASDYTKATIQRFIRYALNIIVKSNIC